VTAQELFENVPAKSLGSTQLAMTMRNNIMMSHPP
jgi:hypothetical protein